MRKRILAKSSQAGSLLINVIVALGIMALMATLAIPYFRMFKPNMELTASARNLASDLRYAQQMTITEQIPFAVSLDTTDSYRVLELATGATSTVKSVVLSGDVNISSVSGFTDNLVVFNSYGSVRESGFITLTNSINSTTTIVVKPSGYIESE